VEWREEEGLASTITEMVPVVKSYFPMSAQIPHSFCAEKNSIEISLPYE